MNWFLYDWDLCHERLGLAQELLEDQYFSVKYISILNLITLTLRDWTIDGVMTYVQMTSRCNFSNQ